MRPATAGLFVLLAFAGCNVYFFMSDSRRIKDLQAQQSNLQRQQQLLQGQQSTLQADQTKLMQRQEAAGARPLDQGQSQQRPSTAPQEAAPIRQIKVAVPELSQRVCGSPAIDGYSHVVPSCLEESPTAKWWEAWKAGGGQPEDMLIHYEYEADFDGLAVGWGINNKKKSARECGEACKNHQPGPHVGGPFQSLPCNAFVWCPLENPICFEPDAHKHTAGDCWLKFTEGPAEPEVNFRGALSDDFRRRHPNAPQRVQWVAGVVLPPGTPLGNGTLGPRFKW